MVNNIRKIHGFKTMAIWSTKTNLVGVYIWSFLYLRIIRKPFVLPDSGKGCVTHQQQKLIKNNNSLSMITRCFIHNFLGRLSSSHPCLILGNSFSCTSTHGGGSSSEIFSLAPSFFLSLLSPLVEKFHPPCGRIAASSSFGRAFWKPYGRQWALYYPPCAPDANKGR